MCVWWGQTACTRALKKHSSSQQASQEGDLQGLKLRTITFISQGPQRDSLYPSSSPPTLFPNRKRLKDGVQGPSHPETLCGSNRKGLPVQSCLDYCPFSSSFLSQIAGKTHDRVTSPRANLSFCSASHWYPRALQWALTETHTHQLMQLNIKNATQLKKG